MYKKSGTDSYLGYNSATQNVNIDIIGFNIYIGWKGSTFGTFDSSGYPTVGYTNPPFEVRVTLDCKYKDAGDTDIQTISDTAHGSYAGD